MEEVKGMRGEKKSLKNNTYKLLSSKSVNKNTQIKCFYA